MKDKLKKFFAEHRDNVVFYMAMLDLAGVMLSLTLISNNTERESTSEEEIKAKSFDYKGHQYILFDENHTFGASSILHDPDCKKCILTK